MKHFGAVEFGLIQIKHILGDDSLLGARDVVDPDQEGEDFRDQWRSR